MALAIATNNAALRAAASASSVNRDMETSMARLSSGKRINSASDDAAGVAIASRLTAEIRGTNQAVRNALDGQALLDTAEGAHQEVENILQRMREITVQAANDTNNQQDRDNLQAELNALSTEINRIASTTTWAGTGLLSGNGSGGLGTSTDFSFQVGANTSEANRISVQINAMSTEALGFDSTAAVAAVPQIGGEAQAVTMSAGANSTASGSTVSLDSTTVTSGGEAQAVNITGSTNSTAAGSVFSLDTQTVTSGGDSQAVTIADGKQTTASGSVISLNSKNYYGFVINGVSTNDESGWSVSGAGDVNGDGLDDVIIGARYDDPNGSETGASTVVFGKADGIAVELSEIEASSNPGGFVINGVSTQDRSGWSVSDAGDVNGDGLADVIVGARYDDPNGLSSGASTVVFGKADGTAVELSEIESSANTGGFVINGVSQDDGAGISVSGAGDVNGDGLADLIVGAYSDDGNENNSGTSTVVFGKADGTAVELSEIESNANTGGFVINGDSSNDWTGWSVSGAGDVNGDGLADLIVGTFRDDRMGPDTGASSVIFGKANGEAVELSEIKSNAYSGGFHINGVSGGDYSGWSVSGAGDVNGDGLADLIVGAYQDDPNHGNSGASFVVFGKVDGTAIELSEIEASANLQNSVSVTTPQKVGNEFQMNTTALGNQEYSDLRPYPNGDSPSNGGTKSAYLTNGNWVNVWTNEDTSISVRVFGPDGSHLSEEFVANQSTNNQNSQPTVASMSNGGFTISWKTTSADGTSDAIFARIFNENLEAVTAEIMISDPAKQSVQNGQYVTRYNSPAITELTNGNLVISYDGVTDLYPGDNSWGVTATILAPSGAVVKNQFQLHGAVNNGQYEPKIASMSNGGFVVAYENTATYSSWQVTGRTFNSDGTPTRNEVALHGGIGAMKPDLVGLNNGGILAVWHNVISNDISARVFDNMLNPITNEVVINSSNTNQSYPTAVQLNDDGLIIAWQSLNQDGSGYGVFGQRLDSNLQVVGTEFSINQHTDADQKDIKLASGNGNTFLASWTSTNQDADGTGIFGQIFDTGSSHALNGFAINGVSADDFSGYAVSGAGDVNGDGLADVIVGAYQDDPNGNKSGASTVVFGKADGTVVELSAIESGSNSGGFVINGVSAEDWSGFSVSGAGDVNGDGLADLIVGAPLDDPSGSASGASFVVFGKADGTAVELSDVGSGTGTEAALASDVSVVVHNKTLTVDLSAHHDGSTNDYYAAAEAIASAINNDSDLQALGYSAAAATVAEVSAGTYAAGDIIITRADTPTTTTTTLVGNAASFVVEGITVNTDLSAYSANLSGAAAAVASDINANTDLQALDYSATADGGTPGDIIISRADTATTSSTTLAGNSLSVVIEGVTVEVDVSAYSSDISGAASAVAAAINAEGSLQALDYNATVDTSNPGDIVISRANTPITQPYVPAIPATTAMSLTSGDSARNATAKIDTAIKTVNIQRSKLGAVSNRLSHTVNNLTNISSNLSAAQGGIEDADFAKETTDLAKNQILQQASTAMLAQANASKQNVLSLLQG